MTKSENQPEDKAPTFTKSQKVWVEATIADDKPSSNGKFLIEIQSDNLFSNTSLIRAYPERIKTTKQICDEQNTRLASQNEPASTRKFKKGDKVQRRKKLEGRDLRKTLPSLPFDEIFTIAEDEKNPWEIKVKWGDKTAQGGFIYFELVEPAPEPKYWLHESPKTYSIYYKGQFGRVITAMLMQKELYTLEEAQEQCDRLNQKESHDC